MSLARLMEAVPPVQPLNVDNTDNWLLAQRELGVELPADFLEYALRYGSGDFGDPLWLSIKNPLNSKFVPSVRHSLDCLAAYNQILANFGTSPRRLGALDGPPLDLFPVRPGFLPIGSSLTGDTLGWWTEGEPGDWPVVLVLRNARDDYGRVFPMSLTEFLARLHSEPWRTEMGGPLDWEGESRPERPEFQQSRFAC